MCRSRAEGGRRCRGRSGPPSAGTPGRGQPGPAARQAALTDGISSVGQILEQAGESATADRQFALEQAAAGIRHVYMSTAGRDDPEENELREAFLVVAGNINSGLDDETADRQELLEQASEAIGDLAATARALRGPVPSPA